MSTLITSGEVYVLITALAMVGGWVWFFSRQATQMGELLRRVAAVESHQQIRDEKLAAVDARLARMEPMLEILVRSLRLEHEASKR